MRNAIRPSRVLRITYEVPSVVEPRYSLHIVVEANVTERIPHRPIAHLSFAFPFRKEQIATTVRGYEINEMLGTKMRALFQRRRGRDLFDLHRAVSMPLQGFSSAEVMESFRHYLDAEKSRAGRAEFTALLAGHMADPGFRSDMHDLLRQGIEYDPQEAARLVQRELIDLLPN